MRVAWGDWLLVRAAVMRTSSSSASCARRHSEPLARSFTENRRLSNGFRLCFNLVGLGQSLIRFPVYTYQGNQRSGSWQHLLKCSALMEQASWFSAVTAVTIPPDSVRCNRAMSGGVAAIMSRMAALSRASMSCAWGCSHAHNRDLGHLWLKSHGKGEAWNLV
eukprot:845399-Amphidinium_carterae.1